MASATSMNPSIPSADGSCHILRIPPELRLDIYDFLLTDFELNIKKPTPPVLSTCRLIRKEATNAYLAWLEKQDEASQRERIDRHKALDAKLDEIIGECRLRKISCEQARQQINQVERESAADMKKYDRHDDVVLRELEKFEREREEGIMGGDEGKGEGEGEEK